MSQQIRFDGKVVVITGSGAGLGKTYALFFASRGAKVVVNDLGTTSSGSGHSKVADTVVEEIRKAGGTAVANYDSVTEGAKIIKTAIDNFGRVDVVINNAGFVRDKSFVKMTPEEWDAIIKVHLYGHYSMCAAAWPHMRNQKYGRIINVSSSSGIYGNFGQVNYSAAKLGVHGLTLALAKEVGSTDIKVNTICPVAATRMTEGVLSAEFLEVLKPEFITPFVAVLASEKCPENGALYELGGGFITKLRWQRGFGAYFDLPGINPEEILARFGEITDFSKGEFPTGGSETFQKIVKNLERHKAEGKFPLKYPAPGQQTTAAAPAQAAPQGGESKTPKADAIFDLMAEFCRRGEAKEIVKKLSAIYNFEIVARIKDPRSVIKCWILDLKNGTGKVFPGRDTNADATFTMTEQDFDDVCMGRVHPQQSFSSGKMRIRGGMKKASAFTPDLFPPPTPENIAKYKAPKL